MSEEQSAPSQLQAAKKINATIRYTMFSVFAVTHRLAGKTSDERHALADELTKSLDDLVTHRGLEIRGWYDVAGLRDDADFVVWWHAEEIEVVQEAYRRVLGSDLGAHLDSTWSNVALHRQAEFNAMHVPDFMAGTEPKQYVCIYPFVRSYDWYLLPDDERRAILAEHGRAARDYPDVRANTVAAFALGDYEWLLAFEADDLARIVDLMRVMRGTEARRHVRVEIPFYTGRLTPLSDIVSRLQ